MSGTRPAPESAAAGARYDMVPTHIAVGIRMFPASRAKRLAAFVVLVGIGQLAAQRAGAQPQGVLNELKTLHGRIANPGAVLSAAEAQRAADRLAEWGLEPERLSADDRGRLRQVELYIALARGDAARALELARGLLAEQPEDQAALEAAYLSACAAGDAQLATQVLEQLGKTATGQQRRLLSLRRRWVRGVGEKAPDVTIRTEDLTEFSTTRRGERVLLIDFWNVLTPPDEATMRALRELYGEYRHNLYIEFVGVNADAESRIAEAQAFAKQNGLVWKQRYEAQAQEAPITHQAFHAGTPPWQVLIDTFGYIRAIGAASEPGFVYAVRAAVAEAQGQYELVMPRTRAGQQAQRGGAAPETREKEEAGDKPAGPLPSNPEALQKLQLARTYLKTGKRTDARRLFEEIVRDFPGTQEAREAQEYLDSIWGAP